MIKASWCSSCKKVAPVVEAAVQHYPTPIGVIVLDVSDDEAIARSEAEAKAQGVGEIFAAWKGGTPTIAVVEPDGEWRRIGGGLLEESTYTAALDEASGR